MYEYDKSGLRLSIYNIVAGNGHRTMGDCWNGVKRGTMGNGWGDNDGDDGML